MESGDPLLPDAQLFGRHVWHVDGLRLGRIDAVVHRLDGERLALVRRRRFVRRWSFVSLTGATMVDGRVVASAGYGRARAMIVSTTSDLASA
jgi:hypothetical protein